MVLDWNQKIILSLLIFIASPTLADERSSLQISCESSRVRIEVVVCTDPQIPNQHRFLTEQIDENLIMNRLINQDPHALKNTNLSWFEALKTTCSDEFDDIFYEIVVACLRQEYNMLMISAGRTDVRSSTGVIVPCYDLDERFDDAIFSTRTVGFCFFVSSMIFEREFENRISLLANSHQTHTIARIKSEFRINRLDKRLKENAILNFNSYITMGVNQRKIADCNLVISLFGEKNESFGGLCVLESEDRLENVAICHDTMVGHFWLVPVEEVGFNIIDLSLFVTSRCVGG